ncbi:DNA replication and repair protein RecF [Vallitalea longa]|uniref:DNA replication and repair protein RecF n=1 Tax=Vallitalea longa TaxID=2936439 RepID=A0A9W5YAF1_9FIRM|nr:DNA replication/repair protein RecF [Vallitalea longa]GKX30322.1 DNA replication and repair protein RecF [Vallitalea longa]
MFIKRLSLKDYRNYKYTVVNFSDGINILFGKNAQGKTNIIEAIYLCATSKSHRTSSDKELINLEKSEAHIKLTVNKKGIDENVDIHIKKNNRKGIAINRIPIKKLNELLGIVNVIIFSPEDLGLIKNGPKERRKFLNLELCQLDNIYYYNLQQYQKILKQRNNLLKTLKKTGKIDETINIWDNQLVHFGTKIIYKRKEFIDKLNLIINKIHSDISGNKENLQIEYEKNVNDGNFKQKLENNLDKDIRFGTTSVGPHRDDMMFLVNGIDIRKYGSQGQQRTAALSLKLSEIKLVIDKIDDTPILLLDDVLSELDDERQKYLIHSLKNIQTIITCTGVEDYIKNSIDIGKLYKVNNGEVALYELPYKNSNSSH